MRLFYLSIYIFFICFKAFGASVFFNDVNVLCDYQELCARHQDKYLSLLWRDIELETLKENLRETLVDPSLGSFSYEVIRDARGHKLKIYIHIKKG